MFKNLPMRWKLFIPIMVLLACGFLTSSFISHKYSNEYIMKKIHQSLEEESRRSSDVLLQEINRASIELELVKVLLTDTINTNVFARKNLEHKFYEWAVSNPFLKGTWIDWIPDHFDGKDKELGRFNFFWARNQKNEVVMQKPYLWDDVKDMPYFKEAQMAREQVIVEPYLDTLNDGFEFVSSMSVPIINKNGTFLGVIGCDFSMDHIQNYLEKARPYGKGIIRLITDDLVVVADNDRENISRKWPIEIERDSIKKNILLENSFYITSYEPSLKEDAIKFFRPVKIGLTQKIWYFASIVPLSAVHGETNVLFFIQVGALCLVFLILGFILWIFVCEIEKKLSEFSDMILESALSLNEMSEALHETKLNLEELENIQSNLRDISYFSVGEIKKKFKDNAQKTNETQNALKQCEKFSRQGTQVIDEILLHFSVIKNTQDPLISKAYYEAIEEGVNSSKKCKTLFLDMMNEILDSKSNSDKIQGIIEKQEEETHKISETLKNLQIISNKHHDLSQKVTESSSKLGRKSKSLMGHIKRLSKVISGDKD